jgi:hypothetical protein
MTAAIEPSTGAVSPGRAFAAACATHGVRAAIELATTITESFPGFKVRPRLALRNLFKVVPTEHRPARYWMETAPGEPPPVAVHDVALRPEAAFEFRADHVAVRPTTAWVQVPASLLEDPEALTAFIDYRLLVRLATAENQALAIGPGGDRVRGLLETPGLRRLPARGSVIASLLGAFDQVEQVGGSADGIVLNPGDYFAHLMGQHGLLAEIAQLGIRIVRTRMIPAGTAVVGDFAAGATLFDARRSTIRFAEPAPGTFPRDGLAVCGEIEEALAIHLPTHFFIAALV